MDKQQSLIFPLNQKVLHASIWGLVALLQKGHDAQADKPLQQERRKQICGSVGDVPSHCCCSLEHRTTGMRWTTWAAAPTHISPSSVKNAQVRPSPQHPKSASLSNSECTRACPPAQTC